MYDVYADATAGFSPATDDSGTDMSPCVTPVRESDQLNTPQHVLADMRADKSFCALYSAFCLGCD